MICVHKVHLSLGAGGVKELRRTQLKRRLIASWQPEIEKSEAQSGPGPKQIEHFSPLVNGILLAQKLG